MNVKQPITVELAEQMLAVGRRFDHPCPVKQCRRLGKAALRTGDRHHLAAEGLRSGRERAGAAYALPARFPPKVGSDCARVTLPLRSCTQPANLF